MMFYNSVPPISGQHQRKRAKCKDIHSMKWKAKETITHVGILHQRNIKEHQALQTGSVITVRQIVKHEERTGKVWSKQDWKAFGSTSTYVCTRVIGNAGETLDTKRKQVIHEQSQGVATGNAIEQSLSRSIGISFRLLNFKHQTNHILLRCYKTVVLHWKQPTPFAFSSDPTGRSVEGGQP